MQVFVKTDFTPYPSLQNAAYSAPISFPNGRWARMTPPSPPPLDQQAMEDAAYSAPISFSSGPWARMNPAGVELIRRCLSRDETERPTAKEALMHEWFGC